MPGWKNALLLGLLVTLGVRPAACHAHHHDEFEIVPEDRREELLLKWEQEVS
jgi:hypothetical protein